MLSKIGFLVSYDHCTPAIGCTPYLTMRINVPIDIPAQIDLGDISR